MNYIEIYTNFLKKFLKSKRRLKVVFDCSNGTTGLVLKKLFPGQKFINEKPDGRFPGHGPNPMAAGAIKQLERAVKKYKANLGFIFDADGDRMFLIDDLGRTVSPDETGYLLLQELKSKSYVVSVISGWLLRRKVSGVRHQVSRVGHYFFKKLMREKKIPLGLEHSGHYYFHFPEFKAVWDSGILAAIQIINFASKLNQPISGYLDSLPKYYRSGEINLKIKNEELKMKILKKVEKFYKKQGAKIDKLDGLTIEFLGTRPELVEGWFNLRPSNTENLLRLNAEATSKKILQEKLREIKQLIKN